MYVCGSDWFTHYGPVKHWVHCKSTSHPPHQIILCTLLASIRLKAEVGWVPWGSFVDLHWSFSLAYTSNIFSTFKLWSWGGIAPLHSMTTRLVATVFWLRATDQRRNSWLSEVHVHINSVIQMNQQSFQQSWQFSLPRKSVYCVYK